MIRKTSFWLALLSLVLCLTAPALYFAGMVHIDAYKAMLSIGTASWFTFATAWAVRPRKL